MIESDLAPALAQKHFGYGRLDADLRVIDRVGPLVDWMPPPGEKIFSSPVFLGMEVEFAALRGDDAPPIGLPGLRLASFDSPPFSVSVLYDSPRDGFLVFASADHDARAIEWRLARERREAEALEHRAQAAGQLIQEQAALYRDIVETAGDLVFRLDADLRFTFVNRQACRLLLLPESAFIGREADQVLDCATPEENWRARLAPRGDCSFEQGLRIPGREIQWIWWRVNWIGDRRGFGEYQAVGRDISDLRRLRAEAAQGAEEARRNAVMRERLRIAHDLHDTLVRSLVALAPQIHLIRKVAGRDADPRLIDELARAEGAVRDGLALARAALIDLRAGHVEARGLGAALEELARRFSDRTGINALVEFNPRAGTAEGETAEALYRICEEALRNIEWHASASRVGVALDVDETGTHTLVVADDGVGFDPDRIEAGHFGLTGMREKAESIGARFTLDTAPGDGVRIWIIAPPIRPG